MKGTARKSAKKESAGDIPVSAGSGGHRERILKAALALLAKHGRDALTTRAVAEAAKVQPPILYRLFVDKTGLLNAVAEYGFENYLRRKRSPENSKDPVEALRAGWRLHVEFGLENPELYLLMYANPHPGTESQAAQNAHGMLKQHIRCVAVAGQLRVSEERAADLFHAAAFGTVMTLLARPSDQRDMALSSFTCDAALRSILANQPAGPVGKITATASSLRGLIEEAERKKPATVSVLTGAERCLLIEWLRRLADDSV